MVFPEFELHYDGDIDPRILALEDENNDGTIPLNTEKETETQIKDLNPNGGAYFTFTTPEADIAEYWRQVGDQMSPEDVKEDFPDADSFVPYWTNPQEMANQIPGHDTKGFIYNAINISVYDGEVKIEEVGDVRRFLE